jgi:hypothetical protein
MAKGILDQHQDSESASFGFGQAAGVKYRGGLFTPSISGFLTSFGFSRDVGVNDVKIYFDSTVSNLPEHAVGSELYSFIVPVAQLTTYGVYDLPIPLRLQAGKQYCFYLAPFSGGVYSDDYRDAHGIANLTFHYATYMDPNPFTTPNRGRTRPRPFAPGIAR